MRHPQRPSPPADHATATRRIFCLLAAALLANHAGAQDIEAPPDPPPPPPPGFSESALEEGGPPFDNPEQRFQKLLRNAPPEKRRELQKNLERWQELPEERRTMLRQHAERRIRFMREEFQRVSEKYGLDNLPEEQKRRLQMRYFEERRKLEEELRREVEEKRRKGVDAIMRKLQDELNQE